MVTHWEQLYQHMLLLCYKVRLGEEFQLITYGHSLGTAVSTHSVALLQGELQRRLGEVFW